MLTNTTMAMARRMGMAVVLAMAATAEVSACSNVFMANTNPETGEVCASVARCMDFELWGGNMFGYGLVGDENTADINMRPNPTNQMKWTTAYGFMGQTLLGTYVINDGVNTEGLYAGMLALVGFTQYPQYDPADKRPELGVLELGTYALGSAKSVVELLDVDKRTGKLMDAQIVESAVALGGNFLGFGAHFVFRDKTGDSLVVEFVGGLRHFYFHKAGTKKIVEIIDGQPNYKKEYRDTEGAVLTNAPTYDWHLKSCAKPAYLKLFTGNTSKKWDGSCMNGSGLVGIPGGYTPPGRFIRASILARLFPKPLTQDDAMYASYTLLQTVIVLPGSNPSPSNFLTWIDLRNSIFNFKPLFIPVPVGSKIQSFGVSLIKKNLYDWQTYDCKSITGGQTPVPDGWKSAKVSQGSTASEADVQKVRGEIAAPTGGNMIQDIYFIDAQD